MGQGMTRMDMLSTERLRHMRSRTPMARMAMEADSGGGQTYETGLIVVTASVTGRFALAGR